MSPGELRAAMKARKKELRAAVRVMKQQARERTAQIPAVKEARARRRRILRNLGVVIILLLLMLMRCECGPGVPPAVEPKVVEKIEVKPKKKVVVKVAPKKPLDGQGTKTNRGALGVGAPAPPTWIDEFQLQVAARSPRLALCFTGVERPGAIRWSTSVNPTSGIAADHEFEPIGVSTELTPVQQECIVKVLQNPAYKLTAPEKEGLPNRVSLVIEF